jgi:hypothetical protein
MVIGSSAYNDPKDITKHLKMHHIILFAYKSAQYEQDKISFLYAGTDYKFVFEAAGQSVNITGSDFFFDAFKILFYL